MRKTVMHIFIRSSQTLSTEVRYLPADQPTGDFDNSMELMETGLFDSFGFKRLHVAGHPEGNKDIDPSGGRANVDAPAIA